MIPEFSPLHTLFLRRQATLFVDAGGETLPASLMEAFDINLAAIGYAVSTRLRARLQSLPAQHLSAIQAGIRAVVLEDVGANHVHMPLFRQFPDNIPDDTFELWCRKVLSHFMQAQDQPCLHCGRTGTTHVLNPCRHVVCDACYDGANYSACPVCERHVDRNNAFFKPAPGLTLPKETVRLKLLDLGASLDDAAQELLLALCTRKQALSPVDRDALLVLLRAYGLRALPWLPDEIPVRENIALVFGTLLQDADPAAVMAAAARHMGTANDVLRLVAAYSGADPSLQGHTELRKRAVAEIRHLPKYQNWFTADSYWSRQSSIDLPVRLFRFKVAKLGRPLRRALLAFMENLRPDSLTEDMLRHRSYWVWLGEFLHPGEYRQRYPQVALAFDIVRTKAPDGTPAPVFRNYYAQLELAAARQDPRAMTALLRQRPGELARRFDHALRVADADGPAVDELMAAFARAAPRFATPVLLTLRALLPTRAAPAATRIFWPKGKVSKGVFRPDHRAPLSDEAIRRAVAAVETVLLERFAALPPFDDFLIDTALQDIVAPFNERSASRSAIQLPRGSTLAVAAGKTARLFLHWCEPEKGGSRTDLDLSVGFYDEQWQHQGTCSYYQHKFLAADGQAIATSAGDLQDAPFPEGATEFIDLDCELARREGVRYAVAVLNNYNGMAFEDLERAFAGVMFRDDVHGEHFDPRSVELKFDLQGGNGIFMPMVFDLRENRLHWLDVYSQGEFAFNNVATSNSAITTICPAMMGYFGSGVRTSMYDLALLHAAARGGRVVLRGAGAMRAVARHDGEDNLAFLERLRGGAGQRLEHYRPAPQRPVFAALLTADVELPAQSAVYALKAGIAAATLSAADLIA
ncbi:MXAN_6230/SCO0854 family RING domain-containing protein [Janthinobacterium fluminis]|uniref:RING-type domain-containing protein n=1 Tax=Janthinobacterium fluminis TaxID=2987524 RepID=A0ABT5JYW8_9BURK|nr:MXAN_6230/SCO0854 family RING domain-containing protein [Janthinobacterium fluminis]MDC8757928.1 hypothetical protein [Janthinobacterium fluminis]